MIGLLRAESIKLTKRWLYWLMILVLAALVGTVAVVFLLLPRVAPGAIEGMPVVEKPDIYILGAQQVLGQTWFPLILAVVLLGGEVSTSVWAAQLTFEARRWMHLVAKLVVITIAAWIAVLAAIGGWSLVALVFAKGSGALPAATWWDMVWKTGITELTWVAIGLGVVALVRSTGIAIGVTLAFTFAESLLSLWKPFRAVALNVNTSAMLGNLGSLDVGGFGGIMGGNIPFARAVVVVLAWTVVGFVLAFAGLQLRDA